MNAFAIPLHEGINKAASFQRSTYYTEAVEMSGSELDRFNKVFGLTEFVLGHVREGKLVVADFGKVLDPMFEESIAKLQSPHHDESLDPKQVVLQGQIPKFRVFTAEPNKQEFRIPVSPFDPQSHGLKFYMRLRPYMSTASWATEDPLYNAVLRLDFLVTDNLGRIVVEDVWGSFPGKGRIGSIDSQGNFSPLLGEEPVFHPYKAISMNLWFNTSIEEEEPNSLSITQDFSHSLMLSAEIHDLASIETIEIPEDPKLKLFFWQVSRLLRRQANTQKLY